MEAITAGSEGTLLYNVSYFSERQDAISFGSVNELIQGATSVFELSFFYFFEKVSIFEFTKMFSHLLVPYGPFLSFSASHCIHVLSL